MKKKIRLTRSEQAFERAAARGEFRPSSQEEFNLIVEALEKLKKDLNLKKKVKKIGIP